MPPFMPAFNTQLLPQASFESIIKAMGTRVAWQQSHACLCTRGGVSSLNDLSINGSPDPRCMTCYGLGTYWDAPSNPFTALMTQSNQPRSPNEMGADVDKTVGEYLAGAPSLTIPYLDPTNPTQPLAAWLNTSTDDLFIEVDAQARYTAFLRAGSNEIIPVQSQMIVAPTGAVRVYDNVNYVTTVTNNYRVSGASVLLMGYPEGTSYMVEFLAAPQYVVFRRSGGFPHMRPLGNAVNSLPRVFQLQTLDIWLRARQQVGNYQPGSQNGSINATIMATLTGQMKLG